MKLIKSINNTFKKNWLKFLLTDLIFLSSSFIFILYARARLRYYLNLIQKYSAQFSAIQSTLQNNATGLIQLQSMLDTIQPLVNKMFLFAFFTVPAVIFIIWCITQAANYSLIHNNKIFSLKFYAMFALTTLPAYLLLFALGRAMLEIFTQKFIAMFIDWKFYVYFILLVLALYTTQIFYAHINLKNLKQIVESSTKKALLRFPKLFPLYLGYLGLYFIQGIIMLIIFVNFNSYNYAGLTAPIIGAVLVTLIISWARVAFTLTCAKK